MGIFHSYVNVYQRVAGKIIELIYKYGNLFERFTGNLWVTAHPKKPSHNFDAGCTQQLLSGGDHAVPWQPWVWLVVSKMFGSVVLPWIIVNMYILSGNLTVCVLGNGPFIEDLPIKHGDFPVRYVSLPEGIYIYIYIWVNYNELTATSL